MKKDPAPFINPIDIDKVAENPGLLPYAHHVGSGLIKPEDQGKIKGRALSAMEQQTGRQMKQLYEQMELLASQAKAIKDRVKISEMVYMADMNFEPIIGHTYHLYEKADGRHVLSLIGPDQWGKRMPYEAFIASVALLADHTWEIKEERE